MAAEPLVPTPELQIDTEQTATETIFRCTGRITASTSPLLQGAVRKVIPEKKTIVVDMSKVTYLDSSGLGAFVGIWISAKKSGCELKLISLTPRVKELFSMTNLDKVLMTVSGVSKFPDTPSF